MIELRLRRDVFYQPAFALALRDVYGVLPAPSRVRARTTLRLIDFARRDGEDGIVVLAPSGEKLWIGRAVVRDSAYIPRGATD